MKNFVEFSSVVDSVRSNAGSALKSVQRQFEEQALKAAGLGEDEEALYRLNKRAQAYLRATDALQQAAAALADDFADAIEDLAMRDVARKFRDTHKSTAAQQQNALAKEVGDPVRQAVDGDNYSMRQKLVSKAFASLIDINLESFRIASSLVEEVHKAAQVALQDNARPRSKTEQVPPAYAPPTRCQTTPTINRRVSAPNVTSPPAKTETVAFEDLIGDMSGGNTSKAPAKSNDLLDFDFERPTEGNVSGTSVPPELQRRASAPANLPFDLDFDALNFGAATPTPAAQPQVPSVPSVNSGLGNLDGMLWPSKEDEDESCIRARVESWQAGKNLRTMLVSLHEVTPSSAGWVPVQLQDVVQPADVKSVYRKAVLAVHPDKHAAGKSGERMLGHLVFETLREQWNVFRSTG